jgi:hypothetical protein
MFDDLRKDSEDQSSFFQDDLSELDPLLQKKPEKAKVGLKINFNSKNFLGMNAFQRFVISALLFFVVCIMGMMLLMITGSIVLY